MAEDFSFDKAIADAREAISQEAKLAAADAERKRIEMEAARRAQEELDAPAKKLLNALERCLQDHPECPADTVLIRRSDNHLCVEWPSPTEMNKSEIRNLKTTDEGVELDGYLCDTPQQALMYLAKDMLESTGRTPIPRKLTALSAMLDKKI